VIDDFDTRVASFYAFMIERENIRLRRSLGWPREEWTYDPIFKIYSFTNVRREHDRTTVLLRQIYDEHFGEQMLEDYGRDWRDDPHNNSANSLNALLLNCAIYRYFGTISAAKTIGWLEDWTTEERSRVIYLGQCGDLKFTAAYIVPNCGRAEPKYEVVCDVIDGLWKISEEIVSQTSWERQVALLRQCWGCGSFMAKEIMLDYVLATQMYPVDWQTWTPVGPGGRRGAGRVLTGRLQTLDEPLALDVIQRVYEVHSEHWREDFVKLDLTDVQFQMCEYDKYSRVAEGRRPKRYFRPTVDAVTRGDAADAAEAVEKARMQ